MSFAEDIKKFMDEKVKPVDFLKLLREDGEDPAPSEDDAPPADDGGFDDSAPDDAGGFDDAGGDLGGFDDAGGDFGGDSSGADLGGSSGDSGESLGDETDKKGDDKFKDREDDPDFTSGLPDPTLSPANAGPSGAGIYEMDKVLQKLNSVIDSDNIDLSEIDNAKNVLEIVANGKKLVDDDFKSVTNNKSFSDIVKRSIEDADERTKNYITYKIKDAILKLQRAKKIDANKANGDVEQTRDLVGSF